MIRSLSWTLIVTEDFHNLPPPAHEQMSAGQPAADARNADRENPEQADLTFWGTSALVAMGIAVMSGSVAPLIPEGFLGGLQANRLQGGTLNQLRAQIEKLEREQDVLLRRANEMRARFSLSERDRNAVSQRVGALETSIPMLLEVVPPGAEIDRFSITASIGTGEEEEFDAEGGSVAVSRKPMFGAPVPLGELMQPVPPPLFTSGSDAEQTRDGMQQNGEVANRQDDPEATEEYTQNTATAGTTAGIPVIATQPSDASISQTTFAIAIGQTVTIENADVLWQDISSKVGALLIGLEPAISDPLQNENFRLVAGPIRNYSQAEMLCSRIERVGIDCLPVQYGEDETPAS